MTVHSRTRSLLATATEVLVADPAASLSDVATAAGIGRTTLHKLYPTRHALLVALARDALDRLEQTYAAARLDDPGEDVAVVLGRLVTALVPLGPRIEFLLRERSLDAEPELTERLARLDEPVRTLAVRAQSSGRLRPGLPDGWVVASLNALVYAAWEEIAAGRLAPVVAPGLVLDTLLAGVGVGVGSAEH